MAALTEEQEEEIKEVFTLFDKNGDNTIVSSELGTVMRSLGKNPTEAELQAMAHEADPNGTGFVTLDSFKVLLSKVSKLDIDRAEELLAAFRELDDGGTASLDAGELRYMLTHLGERLTKDEAQELLRDMGMDASKRVNYVEYVKRSKAVH